MRSPILLKHTSASATAISPIDSLFESRIIMLDSDIDSDAATQVIAMLSYLSNMSSDPIHLYINSPGGSISDGLAIVDCMRGIESPVHTHAFGVAASMASIILACGEPGCRFVAPSAEVMVHQPLTFGNGAVSADGLAQSATRILKKKEQIGSILVHATHASKNAIDEMMSRDTWLNSADAVKYGFADSVETIWMPFLKEQSWV